MTNARKPTPIFEKYTLEQLSERLGLSEHYLLDLKHGKKDLNPHFRHNATRILNQTEEELFGEAEVWEGINEASVADAQHAKGRASTSNRKVIHSADERRWSGCGDG